MKPLTFQEQAKIQRIVEQMDASKAKAREAVQPFSELANKIIGDDSYIKFRNKTGLSENFYYRLKRNKITGNNPPKLSSLVSICKGYDADIMVLQSMMQSLGLIMNVHKDRDYAYMYLMTNTDEKDICKCNEILKEFGLGKNDWLGAKAV